MSCPYTSPQNGKAERTLRTINNMICSLLFQASFPVRYWIDELHTATYLLNHLPSKTIHKSCHMLLSMVSPHPMSTCMCLVASAIPISLLKHLINWHPGPPDMPSSDTLPITKAIGVSISPPITSSSPDMLFLMRQTCPSLSRPI
jgi:hypothetical protein